MEVVQETSRYANITSPDQEYEEIQLKQRKLDIEDQERSQQGSQVELTSKTRNIRTKKSQLYSSVESRKMVETSGISHGAAYTVRLSSKCVVILAMVAIFAAILALVLSALAVITVMTANPNTSRDCKESTNREKMQSVQDIKADMADLQGTLEKSVQKVKVQFEKEIEELKTRLVQLESGNQKIKDWYNRSQHKVNQLERHFQWQRANSSGSNLSHFEMDMKKLWTEAKKTETHFTGIHQQFAGLSTKLNVTTQRLQDAFSRELKSINVTLSTQIDKVTKIPRPVGPPGYINGSQGSGESRDFSQCRHGFAESTKVSSGSSADSVATVIEATGKRIVGATCSTDDAEVSRLRSFEVLSGSNKGKQGYKCDCAGQATVRKSSDGKMTCFIHYWECPLVA